MGNIQDIFSGRTNPSKGSLRTVIVIAVLALLFFASLNQSYLLFHTFVELFSIVIAYTVFVITWNSRKISDNNYLHFIGLTFLFIGFLDLLHTITFKGMNIIESPVVYANQFWIATRMLEALTLIAAFFFLNRTKKANADAILIVYSMITVGITLSILYYKVFPICYIEGYGQTTFKIYAEYVIIGLLFLSAFLLYQKRKSFNSSIFYLLLGSIAFTIISEFCFTLYVSNYGLSNQIGHYTKIISFYLIYEANVVTAFTGPSKLIFKNLSDSEKQYRTLSEHLPELILRFDKNFNCIYANPAMAQIVPADKPLDYQVSLNLRHLPEEFRVALKKVLLLTKTTNSLQDDNLTVEINGNLKYFSLKSIPEKQADNDISYLVICYDNTKQKKIQLELQGLNETKDKFFSIIAHDLKNPFASLLGLTEILNKDSVRLDPERISHFSGMIHKSVKQTYFLLSNLLEWSQIQTGRMDSHPVRLNLEEVLLHAKQGIEIIALAKGIEVKVITSGQYEVFADKQMLNTVLRNLLSNSVKFSYPGGKVIVSSEKKGHFVEVAVTDTGVGLNKEKALQLLNTTRTTSAPGTSDETGTGLGLILCREFIKKNGGDIWLESEQGSGTTFYFTLPVYNAADLN